MSIFNNPIRKLLNWLAEKLSSKKLKEQFNPQANTNTASEIEAAQKIVEDYKSKHAQTAAHISIPTNPQYINPSKANKLQFDKLARQKTFPIQQNIKTESRPTQPTTNIEIIYLPTGNCTVYRDTNNQIQHIAYQFWTVSMSAKKGPPKEMPKTDNFVQTIGFIANAKNIF